MDLAYVAHTESCALLLDEDGVCRWIVPRANATEQLIATSKRCIGARFVASLDPEVEGWLVHEPRVGSQLLFGMMIEDRFALVRVGPLLRFDTMDAKTRVEVIDEQPAALTERDFSRNATSSAPPVSEPAAEEPKPETAETARVSFTNEADATDDANEANDASDIKEEATEADADDLTLDRNAAAKLDAALVQRELVLDEDLPKTAELPAREEPAEKAKSSPPARAEAGATDYDDDIFSSLVAPKPAAIIEPLPAPAHEIYPAAREGVLDLDNDPDALANLFDDDDITNMFARMTTMPPTTTMTSLTDDRDEIVTKNATKSYAPPPPPPSLAPPASVRQSGFAIRVAPAASTSPSTTPVPVPPPTRRDVVAIQARGDVGVEGEETSPFSRVVHEWAAGQEDAASTMRLPLPGRGILPRKSNVR